MNLRGRLEKLERLEGLGAPRNAEQVRSRAMERFLHAQENARREIQGLEPLPDLPYTDADREDDRELLEETLPAYRERPGWQSEEARAFLDYWQQSIEENLRKGD